MSLARQLPVIALVLLGTSVHGESRPSVIVNPDVGQSAISLNGLRAIFGMRHRKWRDGSPVRVFVLDDDETAHQHFCTDVLHVLPHQLRRSWDRLVFSGAGQTPNLVASEEEMLAMIAATPGAIGYVYRKTEPDQVQVLRLE